MATASAIDLGFLYEQILPKRDYKIAIVTAKWNWEVTGSLLAGAEQYLETCGIKADRVIQHVVPGTYELTLGAQKMAKKPEIDAVIVLGCVVKGETPHFDYICQAVALGVMEVGLKFDKPVVFGVLTTNDMQQALERAGGKLGNKGTEAAASALHMLNEFGS